MAEEEETKNETTEEKPATEDSGEGDKPEVYKPIDDANLAAKRLEEATKAQKEENDRTETMMAKRMLGGGTEAGSGVEKKEETAVEYKDRVMRGELNEGT